MKRGDFLLIGSVLLIALGLFLSMFFLRREGSQVVVRTDGRVTAEYPLSEDLTITIEGYAGGSNTLVISGGTAWLTEADCPDKLCVHQGKICYDGQTIVCLPHRIVVEIQGGESESLDGLAR